ncbi:MAG: AAA family ATPase [Lachnospiraceae bacterium]|nr:AAA family ATPase [Lachnospiraceae bacterium]
MSDNDKNPVLALRNLHGTLQPMGEAPEIDPMAQPLWEIDNRFLNPFAPVPPVQVWATMGDRSAIPRSGIITFSAKPKQGKSLSVYALLIPILTGKEFDTITPAIERPRLVIVFDTEMDIATLSKRLATMQEELGENAYRFQVVPMLEIPKSKRRGIIEDITTRYNPDIVAIDQVARMVDNFNDAGENVEFGEWLAQYAAKRTVITVIHQNKAADNTQMKGHLGSILEELAVENYSVSRRQGVFEIKPTNARQSCVDETSATVTFALSSEGRIITATTVMEQNREKEAEQWRKDLRLIFGDDKELKAADIVARIMKQQGLTQRPAETKLSNARLAGAIEHTDPTNNRSPYKLTKAPVSNFDFIDDDPL